MDDSIEARIGAVTNGKLSKQEKAAVKANTRYRNKRLAQYAWKSKNTLVLGFLLTGATIAADLVGPYIVGRVIDREMIEHVGVRNPATFVWILAIYFFSVVLASAFRYGSTWFFQGSSNRISMKLQEDVFNHVQHLPVAYFDKLPAGTVVSRITNDSKAVKVLYDVVLSQLTTAAVYGIAIIIGLALIDPFLLIIAMVPMPILLFLFLDFKIKSAKYNHRFRRGLSQLNANLNENIQGMEQIQAMNQEELIFKEFSQINNYVYDQGYKLTKLWSYSAFNATSALQYAVLGIALLYFGYGQITGRYLMPIGTVYIFIDYMIRLFGQIQNAMTRIGDLERANGAADHMFELLNEKAIEVRETKDTELRGSVCFDDVSFAYIDEKVLKHVSFEAKSGETLAFVGHTGSGKTTIMNLMFSFYEPQEGHIYFDGQDLTSLNPDSIRPRMALVLQDPFIFTGTLFSNIGLNDPAINIEVAEAALRELGAGQMIDRLPDGMLTKVAEKGNSFSAGERQLISFARAMVRNPKILVLDEATASIDSETEGIIQEAIHTLAAGRTTFIIAHRLSTIRHADQIIVMDQGSIVEQGRHEELIARKGLYFDMYTHQSSGS